MGILGKTFVAGSYAIIISFLTWSAYYCLTDKKEANPSRLVQKVTEETNPFSQNILDKKFPFNYDFKPRQEASKEYPHPEYKCVKQYQRKAIILK